MRRTKTQDKEYGMRTEDDDEDEDKGREVKCEKRRERNEERVTRTGQVQNEDKGEARIMKRGHRR